MNVDRAQVMLHPFQQRRRWQSVQCLNKGWYKCHHCHLHCCLHQNLRNWLQHRVVGLGMAIIKADTKKMQTRRYKSGRQFTHSHATLPWCKIQPLSAWEGKADDCAKGLKNIFTLYKFNVAFMIASPTAGKSKWTIFVPNAGCWKYIRLHLFFLTLFFLLFTSLSNFSCVSQVNNLWMGESLGIRLVLWIVFVW